jgi:large conductance mechanosensitive channel
VIVNGPRVERPSFLQTVAPEKVQEAVTAVKKDVKNLAIKSNAVDVALGVLIGAAVTPLASSFVNDLIVPPIALLLGGGELNTRHWVLKDGPTPGTYMTIEEARKDGAIIVRYGAFMQSIINCAVILSVTYTLIRFLKRAREEGGIKQYVQKSAAGTAVGKLLGKVTGAAQPEAQPKTV